MKLDGVTGDARKRLEPEWIKGMEPMYEPKPAPMLRLSAVECRCPLCAERRRDAKTA